MKDPKQFDEGKNTFWTLEFYDYLLSDMVMSQGLENSLMSFNTQKVPWSLANLESIRDHCSQRTLECNSSTDCKRK